MSRGVKMTGAQFKRFMEWEGWDGGKHWDETLFVLRSDQVDDVDADDLDDEEIIEILGGTVYDSEYEAVAAARPFARRFLKSESHLNLRIEVSRDEADAFVEAIKTLPFTTTIRVLK